MSHPLRFVDVMVTYWFCNPVLQVRFLHKAPASNMISTGRAALYHILSSHIAPQQWGFMLQYVQDPLCIGTAQGIFVVY